MLIKSKNLNKHLNIKKSNLFNSNLINSNQFEVINYNDWLQQTRLESLVLNQGFVNF